MNTVPKIVTRDATTINRSVSALHPKARGAFIALEKELARMHQAGETKALFQLFEGLRSPYRQDHLITAGTTKARAWHSAHQYGLACDFVPRMGGQWVWLLSQIGTYDLINFRSAVTRCKLLTPIEWDPFHVEHPLWNALRPLVTD